MKFNMQMVDEALRELKSGTRYAKRGAKHVAEHPSLLGWGVWPALLQFLALALAVRFAFWEGADWIEGLLMSLDLGFFPDESDEISPLPNSLLELQRSAFWMITFFLSSILFVLLTLLGLLVAIFLSAPAMHAMASRVELALDDPDATDMPALEWGAPMQRSGMGLLSWILGQIAFLPLQLFPVFGGLLETTMGLGWSSLVMGRELMDGALSARGLSFGQQVRVVWTQRVSSGALGLIGSLTLWIPLLNVAAFPALVAGATLRVRDLTDEELDPQPDSGEEEGPA